MSPQIKFHKKEKILSIRFNKNKSVDSDVSGNVVVDYDQKGKLVEVDVMDINLNDFVPVKDRQLLVIKESPKSKYRTK